MCKNAGNVKNAERCVKCRNRSLATAEYVTNIQNAVNVKSVKKVKNVCRKCDEYKTFQNVGNDKNILKGYTIQKIAVFYILTVSIFLTVSTFSKFSIF